MAAQRGRFAAGCETLNQRPVLRRIVSGGQTGVDRAALDAALAAGFACGGWCPQGREAEDGPIPEHYPLIETDSADSAQRTELNVRDSDATLIITTLPLNGGTRLAAEIADRLGRPMSVIDIDSTGLGAAIDQVCGFLIAQRIGTLNVAGPRDSESPAAGVFAGKLVDGLLSRVFRA
jgi:hypothetical protein